MLITYRSIVRMVGYGMKMSHDSLVIGIEKSSESPGVVGRDFGDSDSGPVSSFSTLHFSTVLLHFLR